MALPDEKTIAFDIWPNMLIVEGPAPTIGALLESLYHDAHIPRDAWNVQHTERSRQTYAASLKAGSPEKRRQGMGVRTDELAVTVLERARALGLACFRLSKKTQGAI